MISDVDIARQKQLGEEVVHQTPTTPNKPPFSLTSPITRQCSIHTIYTALPRPLDASVSLLTLSSTFFLFSDLF